MKTPLTNKHYGITSCGPDEIGTDDVEFARDLERKLEQVIKESNDKLEENQRKNNVAMDILSTRLHELRRERDALNTGENRRAIGLDMPESSNEEIMQLHSTFDELKERYSTVKKERDEARREHECLATGLIEVGQALGIKGLSVQIPRFMYDEIVSLRADLARISEELGLPPTIGPAPGWLKEQLDNYKAVLAELTAVKKERDNQTKGITPDELGKMVWESMEGKPTQTTCSCSTCLDKAGVDVWWMVICKKCGNKRCPHAKDHNNECTKSNAPGQKESSYE